VKEVLFWVVVCFLFLLAVACAIFGAFVQRGEHRSGRSSTAGA
jgi:Na+-transporting methylmalonyl-CoA/oxaloacetate decarboxylase gamma subunit